MSLSFSTRIEFENHNKLVLYRGHDGFGYQFFAYIVCDMKGYEKLLDDKKTQTSRDINQYGEMLYKAYSNEPDEKAKVFIKNWINNNS